MWADKLLNEADWAVRLYEKIAKKSHKDRLEFVKRAHAFKINPKMKAYPQQKIKVNSQQTIHMILAKRPLVSLTEVYAEVFFALVGQRVSTSALNYEQARLALKRAKQKDRPLLFVLHPHDGRGDWHWRNWRAMLAQGTSRDQKHKTKKLRDAQPNALLELTRQYEVVAMSIRDMREVRSRFKTPRYKAPDDRLPLFVVADSYAKQIEAVTGWQSRAALTRALAKGLLASAKSGELSVVELLRLHTLASTHDDSETR